MVVIVFFICFNQILLEIDTLFTNVMTTVDLLICLFFVSHIISYFKHLNLVFASLTPTDYNLNCKIKRWCIGYIIKSQILLHILKFQILLHFLPQSLIISWHMTIFCIFWHELCNLVCNRHGAPHFSFTAAMDIHKTSLLDFVVSCIKKMTWPSKREELRATCTFVCIISRVLRYLKLINWVVLKMIYSKHTGYNIYTMNAF